MCTISGPSSLWLYCTPGPLTEYEGPSTGWTAFWRHVRFLMLIKHELVPMKQWKFPFGKDEMGPLHWRLTYMSFPSFISLMPRITLLLNQIQWLAFSTVSCLFLITFAESSSRLLKAISATNHQWIHNNQLWLRDYMHSSLPLRIHSTVTHNSHISLPAQNQCCLHVGPSTQWGRRYSSQSSANYYISGIGKKRSQAERSAETSHFPSNPLLFLVRWS